MDIQVEQVGSARRRIRFVIPARKVNNAFAVALQRVAGQARIPGFRPGKAPASMIERMYGTDVRRNVLDKLIGDHLMEALTAADVKAVGRPEIESITELKKDTDLTVEFTVEVLPELDLTGFDGAQLTVEVVTPDAIDVDETLERRRLQRGEWVPVETGAQTGDEVLVDFEVETLGVPGQEGDEAAKPAPMKAEGRRFELGKQNAPPALELVLQGAKAGDHLDKVVSAEELPEAIEAGASIRVHADVHEVRRMEYPAVDDELAKDLGFADLAALRADVEAETGREAERMTRAMRRRSAVDAMLAGNPIELPRALIDRVVDDEFDRLFGGLRANRTARIDEILSGVRGEIEKETVGALKRSLALETIADKAGIDITDADVDAEIEEIVHGQPDRADVIRKAYAKDEARTDLRRRLRTERAMDHLVSVAVITDGEAKTVRAALAEQSRRAAPADDDHDHDSHDHDGHDHDDDGHDHDHDHSHAHAHAAPGGDVG